MYKFENFKKAGICGAFVSVTVCAVVLFSLYLYCYAQIIPGAEIAVAYRPPRVYVHNKLAEIIIGKRALYHC